MSNPIFVKPHFCSVFPPVFNHFIVEQASFTHPIFCLAPLPLQDLKWLYLASLSHYMRGELYFDKEMIVALQLSPWFCLPFGMLLSVAAQKFVKSITPLCLPFNLRASTQFICNHRTLLCQEGELGVQPLGHHQGWFHGHMTHVFAQGPTLRRSLTLFKPLLSPS